MHSTIRLIHIPAILVLLLLAGCAWTGPGKQQPANPADMPALSAAPYHEQALEHLREGRSFMAQGRYELARESYLLALAAAHNSDMRTLAARELETADRMIKSVR